jgi:hypothetical protein
VLPQAGGAEAGRRVRLRVHHGQLGGDPIELGLRVREGRARGEARHTVHLGAGPYVLVPGLGGTGSPELGRGRILELRRQDSDDHVIGAVQHEAATDDRRIGAEAGLPGAMAQHHHLLTPGDVFLRQEGAPDRSLAADALEEAGGDVPASQADGPPVLEQREPVSGGARRRGQAPRRRGDVVHVRGGHAVAQGAVAGVGLPNHEHVAGVPVGERPQQNRVHGAEHGRGGADAQPEREHGHDGEARPRRERAGRVPHVLSHRFQERTLVPRHRPSHRPARAPAPKAGTQRDPHDGGPLPGPEADAVPPPG